MVRKLSSPKGDTSAYDEVWIVVDEDGQDLSWLVRECATRTTKRQSWVAVVSRPSFEVWLIAHYGRVQNYQDQRDAAEHYCRTAGLAVGTKDLPRQFPFGQYAAAVERCRLGAEMAEQRNALPPIPGSGMPHLLRALGLVDR